MDTLQKNSIRQFNSWAKNYDQKFFIPFYLSNKVVVDNLDPKQNSKILDVGCGTGILLDQLLKLDRNLELHGVDISKEMVRVAKQKFTNTPVKIQIGSSENLPYPNNYFDYVTCANSFHHHPNSLNSLKEMQRVSKPGGIFALLDPFNDGVLRRLINKSLNIIFKEGNTHIYTKEEICEMFTKVGFTNIKQRSYLYYKLLSVGIKT